MPYYYHYTTRAGLAGIAGSCEVKRQGQFFEEAPEDGQWRPKENQPQKSNWYGDQHEKGFYLTNLSPDDLEEDPSSLGRLGVGRLNADEQYMFIFWAAQNSFPGREGRDAYVIQQYPRTRKFYIKAKRIDEGDGLIYLGANACFWCGPISQWPTVKNLMG